MPIDGCTHDFATLATAVLPELLQKLRKALEQPHDASYFSQKGRGNGVASILKRLGKNEDFSGLYAFLEAGKPMYVGISRGVIGRLRDHLLGTDHYTASLLYSMACVGCTTKARRDDRMKDALFMKAFEVARSALSNCRVAFIEIPNPLVLYVFEAYAAMAFDCKWNTFRTH